MPVVPRQSLPEVSSQAAPTPYQQSSATADDFGAGQGRALAGLSGSLEKVSNVADNVWQQQKTLQDTADVLDAKAKGDDFLRQKLYGDGGYMTRTGANALGNLPQAKADLSDYFNKLAEGLTDPKQKQAFQSFAQGTIASNLDSMARHEATQRVAYTNEAQTATIAAQGNLVSANPGDDAVAASSIDALTKTIRANPLGKPPELIDEEVKTKVSALQRSRIEALAHSDPGAAIQLADRLKGDLYGGDHAAVDTLLYTEKKRLTNTALAVQIVKGTPLPQSTIAADAVNIQAAGVAMMGQESGGDPAAISPKGAAGISQVMPATAKEISGKIGDGLFTKDTPDAQVQAYLADPAHKSTAALYGLHYLDAQVRRFGDLEAAFVAYNAGPDNAEKWLKAGRDYSVLPKPQETQPYVQGALSRYAKLAGGGEGEGGGRPSIHTEVAAGGLPPIGTKLTPDTIGSAGLKFYKASDFMAPTAGGQWVDARAAKMADMLGQSFYDATGIRVGINDDDHGQGGTEGRRRGTADPADNPHVSNSQHLYGRAFDFQVQNLTPEQKAQFLAMARQVGFTGVGFYEGGSGHLHLDIGRMRSWGTVPDWAKGQTATATLGQSSIATPATLNGLPIPGNMAIGASGQVAPRIQSNADTYGGLGGAWVQQRADLATLGAPVAGPDGAPLVPPPVSFKIPQAPQFDPAAMRAQVDAIPDLESRTAVSRMVEAQISKLDRLKREWQKGVTNEAYRHVLNGGSVYDIPPDAFSAIEEFNPRVIDQLANLEDRKAKGKDIKSDPRYYAHFSLMPDEQFKDVNMVEYADKLSRQDLEKFIDRQKKVIDTDAAPDNSGLLTRKETVTAALAGMGLNLNDHKDQTNAGRAGLFIQRVDQEIEAFKSAHQGTEPRGKDLQEIIDRLKTPVNAADWTGGNKYLFEMGTADQNEARRESLLPPVGDAERLTAATKLEQVPAPALKTIAQNIKTLRGELPKPDEAIQLYNDALTISTGRLIDPPSDKLLQLKTGLRTVLGREPTQDEIRQTWAKHVRKILPF